MSNILDEVMQKDPTVPGTTIRNANVVNPQHPGYIDAIPEDQLPRNLFKEQYDASMHDFGIDHEMLFDIASGSGAPMAIGRVAKGGKSLLNSLLKKMRKGEKLTASEKKLAPQAFDLAVDEMDKAIDLEKATKKFTKMRNKYVDDISGLDEREFYKKLRDFEVDFDPYSPAFDAKKLNELFDAGSYNKYIDNKWGLRSKWGQENIKPIDTPTLEQVKKAGTLGPKFNLNEFMKTQLSNTPGVKSSKNVFEAGRFDILGDAYTGGRFTPGMSKTGSVPGGKTVKRTGVDPIQSPHGIENYYRNLVLETGGKGGLRNFDNMINSRMDWIKRNWDSHKVDMRYNRPADKSFPKVGTKRYLEIRNKLAKEIAWDM